MEPISKEPLDLTNGNKIFSAVSHIYLNYSVVLCIMQYFFLAIISIAVSFKSGYYQIQNKLSV